MNNNIKKYFIKDPETPLHVKDNDPNKWEKRKDNSRKRGNKALQQIEEPPAPISQVLFYVNELLEFIKFDNEVKQRTIQIKQIELDNTKQLIIDNGIIAVNCHWIDYIYDKKTRRYTYYDSKYDIIKTEFDLSYSNDIIWLKFTTDGYLGVVAGSFDINFSYENTAGRLVNSVEKVWDETFVLIFPLTKDILNGRKKTDIETAVGNYLIEKGVPIIDFYSHNY